MYRSTVVELGSLGLDTAPLAGLYETGDDTRARHWLRPRSPANVPGRATAEVGDAVNPPTCSS
jgi:hypothetical protein